MIGVLYELFIAPLTQVYVQKAIIGGSLVAISAGVVGCFIILRRMAFLSDALAHAMLPGIAIAYLVMKMAFGHEADSAAMILGALISAVLTVAMINFVSRVSRIKEDTSIGIIYTSAFAFGGVIVSLFADKVHIDLVHFVVGDIFGVQNSELWVAGGVCVLVVALVLIFFRNLQLVSFDPIMATSIGVPVLLMDYLLTTCTSLVVVMAVGMVGVVMVVGLAITPAATAYLLCDRLSRMLVLSAVFGVASIVGGTYLAVWFNVSGAPPVVLFSTLQFVIVLTVAPRYGLIAGWWRQRQTVPQEDLEKLLRGILLQGKEEGVSRQKLHRKVPLGRETFNRSLRLMERHGLIHLAGDHVTLTQDGLRDARRVLRAHRLWETYLAHVGTDMEEIHTRAEQLQSVNDEGSIEYLDDKLGHPTVDPHGSEIPEDELSLAPGRVVTASVLRDGYRGTIKRIDSDGVEDPGPLYGLDDGLQVTMGPRQQGDQIWTLRLDDDREVLLNHEQADAVKVRIDEVPKKL